MEQTECEVTEPVVLAGYIVLFCLLPQLWAQKRVGDTENDNKDPYSIVGNLSSGPIQLSMLASHSIQLFTSMI